MNALRIYAHGGRRPLGGPQRPARPSPLHEVVAAPSSVAPIVAVAAQQPEIPTATPEPDPPPPAPPPPPTRTSPVDDAALAILTTSPQFGETLSAAYARKERELRDLLATLPAADALALYARLADPRTDDALATAFTRLVAERRARLLAYLADAPRRDAIASARR